MKTASYGDWPGPKGKLEMTPCSTISTCFFFRMLLLGLLSSFLFCIGYGQNAHTNNWAVLVDTSRFWFNYRHAGNVLGFYHR